MTRRRLLILIPLAVVVAIALAIGSLAAWRLGREHVSIALWPNDPLEDVVVIDRAQPNIFDLRAMMNRLDADTGRPWKLRSFQDRGPAYPGESLRGTDVLGKISRQLHLPSLAGDEVSGVVTNLLDRDSRRRNGTFAMIWFVTYPKAEDWLSGQPALFKDQRLEKERTTWWAGRFAIYYAPSAQHDREAEVDRWARDIAACPQDPRVCEAGGAAS